MSFPLALSMLSNLVIALFILVCVALILIILLQKGRGGGLGAAFGGGGAGSLLGTKTGDFLTWVTITLVAGFLILAVLMGKFMRPSGSSSTLSTPLPSPISADLETAGAEIDVEAEDAATDLSDAASETMGASEEADVPAVEDIEEVVPETNTETTE
jgi:preprotein translocase subunit SecG